jgi:polysaccharide export outer membrane protein
LSIILKAPDQQIVDMFKASSGEGGQTQEALYFNGFTVDDKGFIRVPVLGKIYVMGMTLEEIRLEVERLLLKDYFTDEANIFVDVKLPGVNYTINGEIGNTGANVVYKDRATILEAIANSGDITITGDRKNVMIIRQYPQGPEIHFIDLTIRDAMNSPYYFIQPNDYIYIKPLKQKTWGVGVTGIQSYTTVVQVVMTFVTLYLLSTRF